MRVVISTDASFNSKNKIGTYAFYITTDVGVFAQSGILKNSISRPEEAELQCIINAIHFIHKQKIGQILRIIVNTDCMNAVYVLTEDERSIKKFGINSLRISVIKRYNDILNSMMMKKENVRLRYVRAHVDKIKTRYQYENDWCDKEAKRMMNIAIQKLMI